MQTITDLIVKAPNGTISQISHRDNQEHIVSGALCSLLSAGEATHRGTDTPSAWVGDKLNVTDFMGSVVFVGEVLAKRVRLWDMSQPIGKRLTNDQKTKQYDTLYSQHINKRH